MGYRARLGKIAKTEKERMAGKSYDQVEAMQGEMSSPYYPKEHTQLFELGKYFDTPEHLSAFYDFDIYKEAESEFHILSKDGLIAIIDDYHDNIAMMYEEALETKDNACDHIREKARIWGKYSYSRYPLLPYFLDEPEGKCDGFIANSWRYEYSIFNLVYIYRTFDWEKDYLIYSAW